MSAFQKKLNPISYKEFVLQYECTAEEINSSSLSTYHEIYGNKVYISKTTNTKAAAIVHLLKLIKWNGDVTAFGDKQYDMEFLKYFDGTFIQSPIGATLQITQKEIIEAHG